MNDRASSNAGSRWFWLIPLLAALATGAFVFDAWRQRGPLVTISFAHGAGIGAGDPVMFRGVRIGEVARVATSADLSMIEVSARLHKDAAGLAVEGSRFWIVRPEISAGRVTGLDALLGPRYLQGEPGSGKPATKFMGLERPPAAGGDGGLAIVIEAPQTGSIGVDSPIVYRGIRVGSVRGVTLSADARRVDIAAVVDEPYARLVRANTQFWNAGGLGLDWGIIRGLKVQAGSLETLVAGGIAFATPNRPGDEVLDGHRFTLADEAKKEWLDWAPAIPLKGTETAKR
jgi:paraquat-inducible protein B